MNIATASSRVVYSTDHTEGCWRCGATLRLDLLEVTALGDDVPRYMINRAECPTPGCVPVCPSCRQPASDDKDVYIHGPECGPIMLRKASATPATVERGDCR